MALKFTENVYVPSMIAKNVYPSLLQSSPFVSCLVRSVNVNSRMFLQIFRYVTTMNSHA
jgi:hypothetical protein